MIRHKIKSKYLRMSLKIEMKEFRLLKAHQDENDYCAIIRWFPSHHITQQTRNL